MSKPLFVRREDINNPPKRWYIIDEEGNVVYMTEIGTTRDDAILKCMEMGGWLKGRVIDMKKEKNKASI